MSDFPTNIRSFDGTILNQQRIAWPAEAAPGEQPLRFAAGDTTLIYLRHAPRRLFRRTEPIHESLVLELAAPLGDAAAGSALAPGRVVYQAGTEMLLYRSITASGQVVLIKPGVIDVDLTFTSPVVDHENKGDIVLAGRVSID